ADTDKVLVAPGGQSIHHRAEFDGPVFLGGQNDRAGAADGPGASADRVFRPCVFQTSTFRLRSLRSGASRPAMPDDVEMEAWGESHVGFESERLLLLAPAAHSPL